MVKSIFSRYWLGEFLWEQAAGEHRHGVMKTQAGRRILKEDLQLESTGCFTVKKRET